jgi:hypothetical protein
LGIPANGSDAVEMASGRRAETMLVGVLVGTGVGVEVAVDVNVG